MGDTQKWMKRWIDFQGDPGKDTRDCMRHVSMKRSYQIPGHDCLEFIQIEALQEAQAEVERLRELLRKQCNHSQDLREALEFYADRSNWTSKSGRIGVTEIWTDDHDGELGEVYCPSGGKLARQALLGKSGGEV